MAPKRTVAVTRENTPEEKRAHRRQAVRVVRNSRDYLVHCDLVAADDTLKKFTEPDPEDLSIKKRDWENIILSWRKGLQVLANMWNDDE